MLFFELCTLCFDVGAKARWELAKRDIEVKVQSSKH